MEILKYLMILSIAVAAQAEAAGLKMGGNSGGGGNLSAIEPMKAEDLEAFISEHVPRLAEWYFNFAHRPFSEINEPPGFQKLYATREGFRKDLSESGYRKLFLGDEIIQKRMKSTRFVFQRKPCTDPVTLLQKDAAADAEENQICFDVEALVKKVPSHHLRSHVVALAVHEYSHLMGTSEDEAQFIEYMAQMSVKIDGTIFNQIQNEWDVINQSSDLPARFREARKAGLFQDDTLLAVQLIMMTEEIMMEIIQIDHLMYMTGLSPWSVEQIMQVNVLAIKCANLRMFVFHLEPLKNLAQKKIWGESEMIKRWAGHEAEKELLLDEAFFSDSKVMVPVPWRIRNVMNGDRLAIEAEIEDVVALLKVLYPHRDWDGNSPPPDIIHTR